MQRAAVRLHRRLHDALDVEIAERSATWPEHDDLAATRVRCLAIGLAHREHRRDAACMASTRDAHGDLAAIGDEQAVEQRRHQPSLSMQASALETSNLPGA